MHAVELTGVVACAECTGPIAVGAFSDRVLEAAMVLDLRWLAGPGPFTLDVPEGVGAVWIYAFDDPELDGAPSPVAAFGAADGHPIDVGSDPISVLVLTLYAPELPVVVLSGTLTCSDCDGAIAIALHEAPGPEGGALFDAFWIASAGRWRRELPEAAGTFWVSAFRDRDFDLVPDFGSALVTAEASPITIGTSDVAGIDLSVAPLPDSGVLLSGTVSCAACTPPIGLVLFGPPGAPDGEVRAAFWVPAAGVFSVRVPTGLGETWVYAFLDADLDGAPDLGSELVAFDHNPIIIGQSAVGGVAIALATPVVPGGVAIRGTLSCGGCPDIIWIEARQPDDQGAGLIDRRGLLLPGAFTLVVPQGAGRVHVRARAFDDAPEVEAVPSPVTVGAADIAGLRIDLGTVPDGAVAVSGNVRCADCRGAIGVRAEDATGANLLVSQWLIAPGPYTLRVPEHAGEVSILAWRDADFDGLPDAGGEAVASPDGPITIGTSDVTGVDIDLGALPVGPTISGTLTCQGCPGLSAVALFDAPGPPDGALLDLRWVAAPGSWSMPLPVAAQIWVAAFSDEDRDAAPDALTGLVAYPGNPVAIGGEAITGVDLTLEAIVPPHVVVSGEVVCRSCAGVVWVRVFDAPIDVGQVLDDFGRAQAGSFERRYPPGLGAAWFYAFSDADLDRLPDPGFAPTGFAGNPVMIAEDDVAGIVIDLDPEHLADEGPEALEEVEPLPELEPADVSETIDEPVVEPTEDAAEAVEVAEPSPEVVDEAAEDRGDSGCGCQTSGDARADVAPVVFVILSLAALRRRARHLEVPQ